MSTRYVVLYESAENVHEKAPVHFPAHSDRVDESTTAGHCCRSAASPTPRPRDRWQCSRHARPPREFLAGDPFIVNGVVARYEIREWNEVLGG